MKFAVFILILLLFTLSAGCVAGPNNMKDAPKPNVSVAGFWMGLWQGFIAPFVFVISLFKSDLNIYEVHNNGAWYNFGYLFGLACFFGGSGNRSRRRPVSRADVS